MGEDSEEAAYTYHLIGNVHRDIGDLDNAMKYFIEAIMIEKKRLGKNHLDVANTLEAMGKIFKERKEYRNALTCFQGKTNES